jgi:branched-chain amino acid transport system substrate-binding protein
MKVNRKNLCLFVLFVLALSLCDFYFASLYAATEQEVIIGLNIPLTGPYALQGKDQLQAYKLAQEEVNASGGILGRRIRYLYADSKSDPEVSVENVKKFIDEGADMITGGSSSAVAIAVSKLCQSRKKLFLATLTYSNDLTGKDAHRYTFRETYNAWMAAKALGKYLNQRFPKAKYFYITADYTWGWTTRDSMKKFTNSQDAPDILTPLGAQHEVYRDAIQKAMESNRDILVLVLFGRDMVYAMQEAIELGATKKFKQIVVPNLEIHMAIGRQPPYTAGVIGAVPWYWEVPYIYNYEKGKQFVEAYKKRWNEMPGSGGGTAYTNIMLYKWAVEQAKSFRGRDLIPLLENHSFVSLKDKEIIRAYDHQTIQTVYVVRGKESGKDMWDVFEIIQAVPGEEVMPTPEENPVQLEPLD